MANPPVAGVIAGVQSTDGTLALNPDQKKIDMQNKVFLYDPEANPILTVVSVNTMTESQTEVEGKWLEDSPIPEWFALSAGINNAVTAAVLVAGTGKFMLAPTLLRNMDTGEVVFVDVVATDTLTIRRGWGGTTAASMATTDRLLNLRNNQPQAAATAPQSLATLKATKSNFAQIVTHSIKVDKTLDAVELYGGSERVYQRSKSSTEHARDWEQLLLHGQKGSDVTGAQATFTTGGLDMFVTSNILSATGPLPESQWMGYLYSAFRFAVNPGKKRKALYSSSELINTINSWGTAKLQTTPNADKASQRYGIDIREYVSGFGQLSVILHPLLENGSAGRGYIVDHDGVAIRYLRPTTMNTNVQAPEADFYLDKIITQAGFRIAQELCHGIVKGVTF